MWGSVMAAPLIPKGPAHPLGLIYNAPVMSACVRWLRPSLVISENYVANLPLPSESSSAAHAVESVCVQIKRTLISADLLERESLVAHTSPQILFASVALLLGIEGLGFKMVHASLGLDQEDDRFISAEVGVPAGWHPLVAGYDALPEWTGDGPRPAFGTPLPRSGRGAGGEGRPTPWPEVRQLLLDDLASRRRLDLSVGELVRLKRRLRSLYEAGPGAASSVDEGEGSADDEAEEVLGAHIPIPAETFLEELSQKLEVHPISVYWLLEELRADGVRCKPEEQRLLEDRLSVLVLRLLGHRWPKQVEAGEPVPEWADGDGIIPLTSGAGEATVAERLRARLRAEDGDLGAQQAEALLQELTGLSLEEWARRQFFSRHVRQFKHRPIVWHLRSLPQGGKGKRGTAGRLPAFECLVYYHACAGDVLARVRTRYVQPLVLAERRRAEDARRAKDETTEATAMDRVAELEAFAAKLRQVDESGFACADLDKLLASEPLDRWSGDGHSAPTNLDELLRNERAWHVDINDGVRVNVAPLQLAGALAGDVLKTADAQKAIADRARWRADERRWVREGKLPRCGWMPDDVPESPRWRDLAPKREADRLKLEEKRRAVAERLI